MITHCKITKNDLTILFVLSILIFLSLIAFSLIGKQDAPLAGIPWIDREADHTLTGSPWLDGEIDNTLASNPWIDGETDHALAGSPWLDNEAA